MSLRVIIVTQDDPFYMPLFFESFLPSISRDIVIVSVVFLDPFHESFTSFLHRMYRLYGWANFVRRGFNFLIRKGADTLGIGNYSVERIANRHGISTKSLESVNSDTFRRMVSQYEADVVLSVAAPEIFEEETLNAPKWGCLNVHTSELPKYRGMLPTFWALFHGEEQIGVTVHTMSEEIDHGKIAAQSAFSVSKDESLDDVIKKGKRTGGKLAADTLNDLVLDELQLSPMEGEGSYFSFPTAQDRREFKRRGWTLL